MDKTLRTAALAAGCVAGLALPAAASAHPPRAGGDFFAGRVLIGALGLPGSPGRFGPTAPGAFRATLFVSHTGTAGAPDRDCRTAAYSSAQAAVDAAGDRDTVYLCGTQPYHGPVVIEKDLTLTGDPGAAVQANDNDAADQIPASDISTQYSNLRPPHAVVAVLGDVTVNIDGLTIEGPFANSTCPTVGSDDFGVLALGSTDQGANLTLDGDTVTDIVSSTQPECVELGVGVFAGRYHFPTTSGVNETVDFAAHAEIMNTVVHDYQTEGMIFDGDHTTLHVERDVVDGSFAETNPDIASEGIQISRGATGEVDQNLVENNEYRGTEGDSVAQGIQVLGGFNDLPTGGPLDFGVLIDHNQVLDNDEGINVFQGNDTSGGELPTATPVHEQILDNQIAKDDGITNQAQYPDYYNNTYAGYQSGLTDESNSDTIAGNSMTSRDGAFGPSVTPPGTWLTPIDIQSYPDINPHVWGNTYNGRPTNPPYAGEPGGPTAG
jgi:hypothetical protein